MYVIGIDPGKQTGFALWNTETQQFKTVTSMAIHDALTEVERVFVGMPLGIVIVEDARKRLGGFGNMDAEQAKYGAGVREGVGAVKRDSTIWDDFLAARCIPHLMRKPKDTKLGADNFRRLTGWQGATNEHARDAAGAVFGMTDAHVRLALAERDMKQAEALHKLKRSKRKAPKRASSRAHA